MGGGEGNIQGGLDRERRNASTATSINKNCVSVNLPPDWYDKNAPLIVCFCCFSCTQKGKRGGALGKFHASERGVVIEG